jgi:hypothetical protein
MAISVKKAAAGNAPATGMPKTPAPTRQAPPDAVTTIRNPTAQNYGENGPLHNASRTNPGEIVESDLARNLRESANDGEGVLDTIIKQGVHTDLSWQTRDIAAKNVPTHPAMHSANAGGAPARQVPSKLGESVFDPNSVCKPGG